MRCVQMAKFAVMLLFVSAAFADDSAKARMAFQSGDYESALAIWQPLAEGGDADSQFGLGQLYGNGFGVSMDDALAIKWYSLAAEHGHAQAQFNLAVMHQNGWGLPQSDTEAMKLYAMAAEQGISAAMVALGRYYSMDFLDSYDPVLAHKWLKLAYLLHDMDAGPKLDAIEGKMSGEQLAASESEVAAWSRQHESLLANQD